VVTHGKFYQLLIKDVSVLVDFIKQAACILDALQSALMVHGDLKTDNLLVEFNEDKTKLLNVKLIDFGSSFEFDENLAVSDATYEYLPPEIL
jgi:serine/threonine protein kinase